jgi:ActR/RegA family two-component response regulator
MTAERQPLYRVLLVDDDESVLEMMSTALASKGFAVVAVGGVAEALKRIATETFDVLITDLHMPNAGDGFTVISAMKHSQPAALTMLLSGFPDVKSAMESIIREADEIVLKPIEIKRFAEMLRERLLIQKPVRSTIKEKVSEILERSADTIVKDWLDRVKQFPELSRLVLADGERTGHLPKLIADLVSRLNRPVSGSPHDSDAVYSTSAVLHGELRYAQGYTPEMLVYESRILQVTLFGTLNENMSALDFSFLLQDVMAIADEVDAQLTQTMGSFMRLFNFAQVPISSSSRQQLSPKPHTPQQPQLKSPSAHTASSMPNTQSPDA